MEPPVRITAMQRSSSAGVSHFFEGGILMAGWLVGWMWIEVEVEFILTLSGERNYKSCNVVSVV